MSKIIKIGQLFFNL